MSEQKPARINPEPLTSKKEPDLGDMLRNEASACAKHLDEEGLGYSADVVRRCVHELNRLYREHDEDMDRMERAAESVEILIARVEELEAALKKAVYAMRQPLDDWKGEVEVVALDAARAALGERA